jgi:hypothetical protein
VGLITVRGRKLTPITERLVEIMRRGFKSSETKISRR